MTPGFPHEMGKMKTKDLKQEVFFEAAPEEVYEILMDAEMHGDFTRSEVEMDPVVNGEFSVFEGYCQGRNLELIPGKKIVQEWNFAEDGWPEDYFTICTFDLSDFEGGTKLIFIQKGIPSDSYEALRVGWEEYYWEPMKEYLEDD